MISKIIKYTFLVIVTIWLISLSITMYVHMTTTASIKKLKFHFDTLYFMPSKRFNQNEVQLLKSTIGYKQFLYTESKDSVYEFVDKALNEFRNLKKVKSDSIIKIHDIPINN